MRFQTADLFEMHPSAIAAWRNWIKCCLIRRAAVLMLWCRRSISFIRFAATYCERIVYVSCNPATFARDAAVLVEKGYDFMAAGIMNMFAQTAHVETIGWFEMVCSRPRAAE